MTAQAPARPRPLLPDRLEAWVRAHRTVLLSLGIPLALVIAATAWNLQGWPGRADEDEGTYVAEAWAIICEHQLAPYTYWYDHPPLGWAQLAGYIWLTDGFARYSSSIEIRMLLATATSSMNSRPISIELEYLANPSVSQM